MRRDPVRSDGSRPLPAPDAETVRRFCRGEDGEERLCLRCRNPVPGTRRPDALYCRDRCARAAESVRHREQRAAASRDYRRRRRTA